MSQEEWMEKLKKEGFTGIGICPIIADMDFQEHVHEKHTVHVILSGELIVKNENDTRIFKLGDRVEFLAGTAHQVKGGHETGSMIVGVKE